MESGWSGWSSRLQGPWRPAQSQYRTRIHVGTSSACHWSSRCRWPEGRGRQEPVHQETRARHIKNGFFRLDRGVGACGFSINILTFTTNSCPKMPIDWKKNGKNGIDQDHKSIGGGRVKERKHFMCSSLQSGAQPSLTSQTSSRSAGTWAFTSFTWSW